MACLFVDGKMLFLESEEIFLRVIDEFYVLCTRRKVKLNAWKKKDKILHLHNNSVCLRLRIGTVPRPTPYFWS